MTKHCVVFKVGWEGVQNSERDLVIQLSKDIFPHQRVTL